MAKRETSRIEGIVCNCQYVDCSNPDSRDPHISFSLVGDEKKYFLFGRVIPSLANGFYVECLVVDGGLSGLNRKGLFVSKMTVYDKSGTDKRELLSYEGRCSD